MLKQLLSFSFLFTASLYASSCNYYRTGPKVDFFSQDDFTLKETFLSRSFSNTEEYTTAPYFFALGEVLYANGDHEVDFGFTISKLHNGSTVEINQASYSYYGEQIEFKIGKYVNTIGVLDYMSSVNIMNPSRGEFFDETNINIRRVPTFMSEIVYYPSESFKFQTILQAFDNKHQDYTSIYLGFVLDAYLPNYFKSLSSNNSNLNIINEEIFLPTYNSSISPALNQYIQDRYQLGSSADADKASLTLVSEYSGDASNYGAVWMNRYSEIPLIKIDQNVLDIINAAQNNSNVIGEIENYIDSGNGNLISSVDGYRYNQYSLYYEGTADALGIRFEGTYRDKLPTLNEFSWMSSMGVGIDYKADSVYNALELQWLHIDSLNQDLFAGIVTTRFDSLHYSNLEIFFDNYLLFGYYNSLLEVSAFPNVTFRYERFSVVLQYLVSKEQSDLNSASLLIKAIF